jgi:hypothetical protein
VHTVASPNESCSITPDTAKVHNYISAKKGHSGVLTATYTKYYWLPFFWGIAPSEFREFLDACREVMSAFAAAGSPEGPPPGGDFNTQTEAFLERTWRWADGTLPQYLVNRGTPVPNAGDQKIVVFNLCVAVAKAQDTLGSKIEKWRTDAIARQSAMSVEFDEAIKALYPPTAVSRAYLAYKK